ncbi:MAG TPA: J domain-containing protein [Polyangiales bacterium]
MVGEALRMIGRSIEADISRVEVEATSATAPPSPPPTEPAPNVDGGKADAPRVDAPTPEQPPVIVDEEVASAAAVLGVSVDASADEIRAALRARLSSSRLHPDQGGDGEQAKILIAAKNLLIERARAGRS